MECQTILKKQRSNIKKNCYEKHMFSSDTTLKKQDLSKYDRIIKNGQKAFKVDIIEIQENNQNSSQDYIQKNCYEKQMFSSDTTLKKQGLSKYERIIKNDQKAFTDDFLEIQENNYNSSQSQFIQEFTLQCQQNIDYFFNQLQVITDCNSKKITQPTSVDKTKQILDVLETLQFNKSQLNEIIDIINRMDACFNNIMDQIFERIRENNYFLLKLNAYKNNVLIFDGFQKLETEKQKDLMFLIYKNENNQDIKLLLQRAIEQTQNEKKMAILQRQFLFEGNIKILILFKDEYLNNKQAIKQCIQKELQANWNIVNFFERIQQRLEVLSKIKDKFEKILNLLINKKIYLVDYKRELQQVYYFKGFQVSNENQDITCMLFLGKNNIEEAKRFKEKYLFLEQKINRKIIIDYINFGIEMQVLILNKSNKKLVEIKKNMYIEPQKMIDQVKFNFKTINNFSNDYNEIKQNWFNTFQNEIFKSLLDKNYFLFYLIKQENQILLFEGFQDLNSRLNDLVFKIYYQRENQLIDKEFYVIRHYEKKLKDKKILLDYIQVKNDLHILAFDRQEYNNFQVDIKRDLDNQDIQIWDKQQFKLQINQALKNKKTFQKQFDKILDQLIQKNYYLSKCIYDSDKQEENLQFFTGYQMRSLTQQEDLIFQMQHEIDFQKLNREQNIIEMVETDCQEQIMQDYLKFEENIHVTIFKSQKYQQNKKKIEELKNNQQVFVFDWKKVYEKLKQIDKLREHQILFTQWDTITKCLKKRKYFINSYISQGGFGIVLEGYKQISLGKNEDVIFKFLVQETQTSIDNEIQIMKRFDQHQNIVKLLDYFQINQSLNVLVLEKCSNSLRDELELGKKTDKLLNKKQNNSSQVLVNQIGILNESNKLHSDIVSLIVENNLKISQKKQNNFDETEAKCQTKQLEQNRVVKQQSQSNQIEFDTQKLVKIIFDLLDGLVQLRIHSVVHCDIKPQNILVKNNNYLYCDFGVSLVLQDNKKIKANGFTEYYAPPESINHESISFKSDIYSLGKTFRVISYKYLKINEQKTQFIQQIEKIINEKMIIDNATDRYDCLQLHSLFFDSIQCLDDNTNKQFLDIYQQKIFNLCFLHPLSLFDFYSNKDFKFYETAQKYYYKIRKKILFRIYQINLNLLNKIPDFFILQQIKKAYFNFQFVKEKKCGKFLKKIVHLVTTAKLKLKSTVINFNQILLGLSKRYQIKTKDNP